VAWGLGPWGGGAWGGAVGSGLEVVNVQAPAENVIRVEFNLGLYFSGILDPGDASNPDVWQVTPDPGTVGYDGNPSRPVLVVTVAQPSPAPLGVAAGSVVDLTLDRPMTPFPGSYSVATLSSLFSSDLSQQLVAAQLGSTPALFRVLQPPDPTTLAPGRDLANPQTYANALGSNISQPQATFLGSFGYSDDGDYAMDSRDQGLRKRIFRRTFTRKNGFLHLPGYGIGVLQYSKQLGRASARQQLEADAQSQYAQEPEVAQCNVLSRLDPDNPNLVRLDTYLKKKNGQTAKYKTLIPTQ
jgi:hypothetical protein